MNRGFVALLLVLAAPAAGCGLFGRPEDAKVEGILARPGPERPQITIGELDQMSRNYADRLVARISSACDQIKQEDPGDQGNRSKAHHLKLSVALAAYDIVTGQGGAHQVPGAAQHVIDLAILTELEALHWVDEGAARDEFGERGGRALAESFQKGRDDIAEVAGRFMPPEQLDTLKTLVARWRAKNPKVEWLARVRFDVVAQGQENAGFRSSLGQTFNPLQSAVQSVDEARIVSQQALFYLHRMPLLLDWTAEATLTDALGIPRVSGLVNGLQESLQSVSRAAAVLGRLAEPSSQEPAVNTTVMDVKDTLTEARGLIREVHELEEAVRPFLEKSARAPDPGKTTDYEAVASRVDDAARTTTSLVRETRMLAESPDALRNVDDVLSRLSRDVSRNARRVVDHATWRLAELVLLVALLFVVYKVVRYLIRKRSSRPRPS
jgi:hypothetical protein